MIKHHAIRNHHFLLRRPMVSKPSLFAGASYGFETFWNIRNIRQTCNWHRRSIYHQTFQVAKMEKWRCGTWAHLQPMVWFRWFSNFPGKNDGILRWTSRFYLPGGPYPDRKSWNPPRSQPRGVSVAKASNSMVKACAASCLDVGGTSKNTSLVYGRHGWTTFGNHPKKHKRKHGNQLKYEKNIKLTPLEDNSYRYSFFILWFSFDVLYHGT